MALNAVKSGQGTAICEIPKPCPDLVICLSTSRNKFNGRGCFQSQHKDRLVLKEYLEEDHINDRFLGS